MVHSASLRWFFTALLFGFLTVISYDAGAKDRASKLSIAIDENSGEIVVSWSGKGVLKQAEETGGRFKRVHTKGNSYVVDPTGQQMVFQLEGAQGGPIVSINVVGYVNLQLPPGLTLIANPLYFTNNTVAFWWPNAPDGAQVLKYVPEVGYEVSTFDALAGAWSNPEFEIGMGQGFFFRNTSSETIVQTFIGEVLQGTLINPPPAGLSMEGALVPMAGSINSVQQIPGQEGDIIKLWVNDGQGGGDYISSMFSASENAWVPDLNLGVGEGFWTEKQQAQDWVRFFSVN